LCLSTAVFIIRELAAKGEEAAECATVSAYEWTITEMQQHLPLATAIFGFI
jgi:hypothetical protein